MYPNIYYNTIYNNQDAEVTIDRRMDKAYININTYIINIYWNTTQP